MLWITKACRDGETQPRDLVLRGQNEKLEIFRLIHDLSTNMLHDIKQVKVSTISFVIYLLNEYLLDEYI